MNRQRQILFATTLAAIVATAAVLIYVRMHQRLGPPAVKAEPLTGITVKVLLPERVLDYDSKEMEVSKMVVDYLPRDTSYGQRVYQAPDGFLVQTMVVLMGKDRSSLHKPEFCLRGQGWTLDPAGPSESKLNIARPQPYELPIMKILATGQIDKNGTPTLWRGVYVYWFVAEGEYTARHTQRMFWMAKDLLARGVLQRWAYVAYFAQCAPGQEDATFERMKGLIAASVPEFQLTPRPEAPGRTALK